MSAPRRFRSPVATRVKDPDVDLVLRNHDERIRELVREMQKLLKRVEALEP